VSTSAELWTIAEMWQTDVDLTGFTVEAADGKIGTVDQAAWHETFGYLVVNTGPSIFGKQVILPGGVVRRLDLDNETVFVERTRDEILDAPAFDESRADDTGYLQELGSYYAAGGHTD
jgi:hypothetical protein